MVETKRNALPPERGKALPAQNRGITAEWQGNKQRTRGCGGLFMCGKRKSETNGGGRRTYISPKGCPTHQVKHGTKSITATARWPNHRPKRKKAMETQQNSRGEEQQSKISVLEWNTQNTGSGNGVCKPAKTVYITQNLEYIYSLTVKTPPMIKA